MPNYRRYYSPGLPVFITVVTRRRTPWLARGECVELLLSAMRRLKGKYPFRHLAHVILPDHIHWMFEPGDDGDFSRIVGALKREATWRVKRENIVALPLWQARFYDHLIRDEADFARHLDYIHYNPVKHSVAVKVCDYPHSSFAEWVRRGVYLPEWGAVEPDNIREMALE